MSSPEMIGVELVLMTEAEDGVAEPRSRLCQFPLADSCAESPPFGVVADGQDNPLVGSQAGIAPVGGEGWMAVPDAAGATAVEGEVEQTLAHEGDPVLVHGQIYPGALAGAGAVEEGGEDRQLSVPAGQEVRVGIGDLVRDGPGQGTALGVDIEVACECPGAVGGLQCGGHGPEIAPGPGVTVAGVGHHD